MTFNAQAYAQLFMSLPEEIRLWFLNLKPELKDLKTNPEWLTLSNDQWIALYEIMTGRYSRITLCGIAGSGKSYLAKFARKLLTQQNKEVLVMASTGIAAYIAGGNTVNSTLSMGADDNILPIGLNDHVHSTIKPKNSKEVMQHQLRVSVEKIARKVATTKTISRDKRELVVFIDELGMLSSENLTIAVQIIESFLGVTYKKAIRKVRFVFIADYRQILPVKVNKDKGWKVHTNLAIHTAEFSCLRYQVLNGEVNYNHVLNTVDSQIGVVYNTSEDKYETKTNHLVLSLITNHRQKESDGEFINDLNLIGAGKASFNPIDSNFVKSIAERVFYRRGNAFEWWLSKDEVDSNTLKRLKEATHVYYTNLAVSRQNALRTNALMKQLSLTGGDIKQYYRDYPVKMVSRNNTNMDRNKTILDISPVGTTTVVKGEEETYFPPLPKTHTVDNNKTVIMGFQRVCVGMRWMCRKNISDVLKNGTIGTVVYVDDEYFTIELDGNTETHYRVEVETELFVSNDENGNPISRAFGVPGHPAWGITFHKTQGITIPKGNDVVIHIDNLVVNNAKDGNLHGVAYVGLSRVQDPNQLFVSYESSLPVTQGLNQVCTVNPTVFSFINFSEDNMEKLISGEYSHNFDLSKTVSGQSTSETVDESTTQPTMSLSERLKATKAALKS